jgi:hypothetical protein
VEEATVELERAFARLGRTTYRVPGFLTKPHEAIERLGPIDDPLVGVCVHWLYGPHTTEGVVGKENPLLLASNFSGRWPGLVGLLNTGACLSLGRPFSCVWTDRGTFTDDRRSWRASTVVPNRRIAYRKATSRIAPTSPDASAQRARHRSFAIAGRSLMLGDVDGHDRCSALGCSTLRFRRLGGPDVDHRPAAASEGASTTRFASSKTVASPSTGVSRGRGFWKIRHERHVTSPCST